MKRRDFVKTSLCLGCAGAIVAGIPAFKDDLSKIFKNQSDLRAFMYKSEDELPQKVRLDLCNMCQLNCVKCHMRIHEDRIIKENGGFGYVSFETFKNFVDKNPFLEKIETSANGEIFLNPDLEKIIKYAHEKNIRLTARTGVNLNTLSDEMAENLVKYQFEQMTVAIDGATPETYAIYRRGGDFNTVINNVKKINKYKKKYKSEKPYLTYQFILFGHSEHEIEKAKKLAKELNMKIDFVPNCAKDYSPIKNKEKVFKQTGVLISDSYIDSQFELYKKGHNDWFYCTDLFQEPMINFNGELMGCCLNFLDNFKVNIFEKGLLDGLNDFKVAYARYMLSDFDVQPKKEVICSKCYVYDYLKEKNFPMIKKI